MICTPLNYQDVNKYYQNTFVVIPEYDPQKLLVLRKADSVYLWFQDPLTNEEGGLSFKDHNNYHLSFHLPKKMLFQHKENAFMLRRIPARMWRKGIAGENSQLLAYSSNGDLVKLSLQPEFLTVMLSGGDPVPNVSEIDWTKMVSVALSNRIALVKNGSLMVDDCKIGNLNFKSNTAMVLAPFKNHVERFMPKNMKVYYG